MLSVLRSLWTYVGIGLLVFYILLYALLDLPASLQDTASVDPVRTLLGALVTGLITAQALVFTITLVAAQLNARYTHRMVTRVFTWPTALYMGLFIGSSIYSAVVLAALAATTLASSKSTPGISSFFTLNINSAPSRLARTFLTVVSSTSGCGSM